MATYASYSVFDGWVLGFLIGFVGALGLLLTFYYHSQPHPHPIEIFTDVSNGSNIITVLIMAVLPRA
jgi:hypothetical protein